MADDVILQAPANTSPFTRDGVEYAPDADGMVIVPASLVGDLFDHGFTVPFLGGHPNGDLTEIEKIGAADGLGNAPAATAPPGAPAAPAPAEVKGSAPAAAPEAVAPAGA